MKTLLLILLPSFCFAQIRDCKKDYEFHLPVDSMFKADCDVAVLSLYKYGALINQENIARQQAEIIKALRDSIPAYSALIDSIESTNTLKRKKLLEQLEISERKFELKEINQTELLQAVMRLNKELDRAIRVRKVLIYSLSGSVLLNIILLI